MFGYIRPVRSDCDNYLFKAQYCCLCKTLGKRYGQFSRLLLSYDITFMTLLLQALSGNSFSYKYENCIMHPFHKRRVKRNTEIDEFAADISLYFAKKKIEDNIKDEKMIKKTFQQLISIMPMKWNRTKTIEQANLNSYFSHLEKLEQIKKSEIDDMSNCFGDILKTTIHDASEKLSINITNQVEKFAFLMGKLIYTLDAFEDLNMDLKKWNYNPLVYANKDIILMKGKTDEVLKAILSKEKWRLKLLLDHINYTYSFFRFSLGVYHVEIDGIISKSLPAMVYKVIGEPINC